MTARGAMFGAFLALLGFGASGCALLPDEISPQYSVGGAVGGLVGSGLTLSLAGGHDLSVSGNGKFQFPTTVGDGEAYTVTIGAQPRAPAQQCRVLQGNGTVASGNVKDVQVVCSLVVGAFNLEWFAATSPDAKKRGIADIVHTTGYAALGVEEVSSQADLAAFAATWLGPDWDSRLGTTGGDQHVGFVFDTRLVTLVDSGELNTARSGGIIDTSTDQWSGYMRLPYQAHFRTADGGLDFELVVVHLKASSDTSSCNTRRLQVQDLERWLALHEDGPLAVVGDFNDQIPGTGICDSVDTLAPFESDPALTFLTSQPDRMASTYYTLINYRSTIDHVLATPSFVPLVYDLDDSHHKAAVVMDGDKSISDHQPPYVFLAW